MDVRSSGQVYVMRSTVRSTFFLVFTLTMKLHSAEEIWEQDLSKDFEIGASTQGYDRVGLHCAAEKMIVDLEMTEDFSGVLYTQGSFHSRQPSCFLDPIRGTSFTMYIPFDECSTEKVNDKYSNIMIIQHDDELVTPGDAAFILECDFSKPEDFTVLAEFNGTENKEVRSSISLVDADPGRDRTKRSAYVESNSAEVVFIPNLLTNNKVHDEL